MGLIYVIDIDRYIGDHRYFVTMQSTLIQLSGGILSLCLARRHVTPRLAMLPRISGASARLPTVSRRSPSSQALSQLSVGGSPQGDEVGDCRDGLCVGAAVADHLDQSIVREKSGHDDDRHELIDRQSRTLGSDHKPLDLQVHLKV